MGMERYDYVGVGAFLSEDLVKPILAGLSNHQYDAILNYDINRAIPGLIHGEGMDCYAAMIPFIEPAAREGWKMESLKVNDLHVAGLTRNVRAWCLDNFGVEVYAYPMAFSRWW